MNLPFWTAFAVSHKFWIVEFVFICFQKLFFSSLISFLTHSLFNSMLCNLHEFECFLVFSSRLVSHFSLLWSEKNAWNDFDFLDFLRFAFCPIMWYLFVISFKMFHLHLKRMCILLLLDDRFSLYVSGNSIWSRTLFNAAISLLVFCLEVLSIFDCEVLNSSSIMV